MNTRSSAPAAVLLAAALISTLWYLLIYGGPGAVIFCCDAKSYVDGAALVFSEGITADVPLAGYRSVIVFVLIGIIEGIGVTFGVPAIELGRIGVTDFAYQAGALSALVAGAAVVTLAGFGRRGFLLAIGAIYANPLTIAYAVVPLQESLFAILLAPAIAIFYIGLRSETWKMAFYAGAYLAGMAYMLKPSLILMSTAIMFTLLWLVISRKVAPVHLLAAATIAAVIAAPQSYTSWIRAGTLLPYYSGGVFTAQLDWAVSYWRYETVMDGSVRGRGFLTPFQGMSASDAMQSAPVLFTLGLGHMIGAFDHWTPLVYITSSQLPVFPFVNVAVGFLLSVAVLHSVRNLARTPSDVALNAMIAATACMLPLLAVEARFSFLTMLVAGLRAAEWVVSPSRNRASDTVLALIFGCVFAFATSVIHQTAAS